MQNNECVILKFSVYQMVHLTKTIHKWFINRQTGLEVIKPAEVIFFIFFIKLVSLSLSLSHSIMKRY